MGKYSEAAKLATKMTKEALGELPNTIKITQDDLKDLTISDDEKKNVLEIVELLNRASDSKEKQKIIAENIKNISETSILFLKKIIKL